MIAKRRVIGKANRQRGSARLVRRERRFASPKTLEAKIKSVVFTTQILILSKMITANPYLSFKGECEAAFKFYEKCFGGKIQEMRPYAGTPMEEHVPVEGRLKIMHASMEVGGSVLMGADNFDIYVKPAGFLVTLMIDRPEEAERVFAELSEGGAISMPIQETFWATRFGIVADRFAIPWAINCVKSF